MLVSGAYQEAFYWLLFALDSVAENSWNGGDKGLSYHHLMTSIHRVQIFGLIVCHGSKIQKNMVISSFWYLPREM